MEGVSAGGNEEVVTNNSILEAILEAILEVILEVILKVTLAL